MLKRKIKCKDKRIFKTRGEGRQGFSPPHSHPNWMFVPPRAACTPSGLFPFVLVGCCAVLSPCGGSSDWATAGAYAGPGWNQPHPMVQLGAGRSREKLVTQSKVEVRRGKGESKN